MNAAESLGKLRNLHLPAVTTSDAAAVLEITVEAASHMLRRLAQSELVSSIRKGLWALGERPDPLALAEYITAPYPSYVSLQSALYLHGMIEQIPAMTYLVSLARSGRVETKIGTYSVHHIQPELFDGFEHQQQTGLKLATPEKALVDFFYLSTAKSRLFTALPELELPKRFKMSTARAWLQRIPEGRLRTIATRELETAARMAQAWSGPRTTLLARPRSSR